MSARHSTTLLVTLVACCAITGCASLEASPKRASPTPSTQAQFAEQSADWAGRYIECARSFGANAKLVDGGSISEPAAEGRETIDGLDAECIEREGEPPKAPPLTDALLRGMYKLFLEQAECLRSEGYSISEAPSEDEWVETYDGYSWNPLVDVMDSGGDVMEANGLCPQPDPREAELLGAEG